MAIDKKQIAAQLAEAARLLVLLGEDPYRARAFEQAAAAIEAYQGDVLLLLYEDRLTEIRGIGKGLAAELAALKTDDQLAILDHLQARVPEGVRDLFQVSGLGVKKIAALWQSGITDLTALLAAVEDGRVAAIKGFGAKSAAAIGQAARFALTAQQQMRLDVAEAIAAELTAALRAALSEAQVAVAGSLRRACPVVDDIRLVVTRASHTEVRAALAATGDAPIVTGRYHGRPFEAIVIDPEAYGAALAMWTGNSDYRQALVERAGSLGYTLRDDSLFEGDRRLATPSEGELLLYLNLPLLPPERREAAQPEVIEDLVTLSDIRGLVHVHTDWSDGAVSLRSMVAAAQARGYRYLATADHSRSSAYANGLSVERVLAQAEEIEAVRHELDSGFELLHGMEVDILPDGSLDYPEELLAQLDYTVVSVHQSFRLSRRQQTERIVRAVQHPKAKILGHATGRLLLRRPGYEVDLDAVIAACADAGTVLELNGNPHRLDLDWEWVARAKAAGCRFAINPDAHTIQGCDDVRYGVMQARKAGLRVADVVNSAPTASAFLQQLKR
jgi:DNA polymerase (family 10)